MKPKCRTNLERRLSHRFVLVILGLLTALAPGGCGESPPPSPAAPAESAAAVPPPPRQQTAAPPAATPTADRELWDISYIQGNRIGYAHTTVTNTVHQGRKALRVEQVNHLVVVRSGQRTEQEIRTSSVETVAGELIEFSTETIQGTAPVRTVGRVVGDRLELATASQCKRVLTSIPWSKDYAGPYAVELSLLRQPMQPGQQRTIQALDPVLTQVVAHQMTAKDYEPVKLLGGTHQLLRIENVMRLGNGQTLPMVVWSDRTGDVLKTRMEAMGIETHRATKVQALEETDIGNLDFITDLAVKIDRPLPEAHSTKRIRYRVHLDGGDPAGVFVSGPSQRLKSIDPHTAELTVYAIRPGLPGGNPDASDDRPTDADRQPNNMVQSDDERIVAMAQAAVGDQRDPWQMARTLERYVYDFIQEVGFSQAFATAAEVAENPSGDCTEHAVLLTALARACGIPARAAVGLVYMQGKQSFGYHMWTEMYLAGRWIPLDATLARGGIGAAHLKLADSHLKGSSAYSSFLPVVQVIGRLKIEVLEVE